MSICVCLCVFLCVCKCVNDEVNCLTQHLSFIFRKCAFFLFNIRDSIEEVYCNVRSN